MNTCLHSQFHYVTFIHCFVSVNECLLACIAMFMVNFGEVLNLLGILALQICRKMFTALADSDS